MNISKNDGTVAEIMVASYLRKRGCIIAKMNYHSRYGEIDIIAETHKTIMFVEVKMRSKNYIVSPAEAVHYNKQQKILLTAKDFLSKANVSELQPRFDVAEVFKEQNADGKTEFRIHYIKNAFGE